VDSEKTKVQKVEISIDDVAKPVCFSKSLEAFLLEEFRLPRRNCRTLEVKFNAMGISDPSELIKAWKADKFNADWLRTHGEVDDLDVVDVVHNFQTISAAFDHKIDIQKVLGHLGWMREGEQEVNKTLIVV